MLLKHKQTGQEIHVCENCYESMLYPERWNIVNAVEDDAMCVYDESQYYKHADTPDLEHLLDD